MHFLERLAEVRESLWGVARRREAMTLASRMLWLTLLPLAAAENGQGAWASRWARIYRGVAATPWKDHHMRYKYRPGDGTAKKIQEHVAKRRLMDVTDPDTDQPYGSDASGTYTPRTDGKAKMNGELFDYGIFDCPWMHSLDPDYPAMCLPYQEILSPIPAADLPTETVFNVPGGLVGDFAARDSSFTMPDGQRMECSDEIERLTGARCAAGNPVLGHGAICEGVIEDCTFSKAGTRKCDSDVQGVARKDKMYRSRLHGGLRGRPRSLPGGLSGQQRRILCSAGRHG